jgi:hypothetical protein
MLLQSVVAKTHFALKRCEASGSLSAAKIRSSQKSIMGADKQKRISNHF